MQELLAPALGTTQVVNTSEPVVFSGPTISGAATVKTMTISNLGIPPGPTEQYRTAEDIVGWMNEHSERNG
ncbi:hypothetical protein SBBP2_410033 [Burkholderiales bacterium]|nr:hypothetical protein SBBP2_410033 [Burkholderiales bacterium]